MQYQIEYERRVDDTHYPVSNREQFDSSDRLILPTVQDENCVIEFLSSLRLECPPDEQVFKIFSVECELTQFTNHPRIRSGISVKSIDAAGYLYCTALSRQLSFDFSFRVRLQISNPMRNTAVVPGPIHLQVLQ